MFENSCSFFFFIYYYFFHFLFKFLNRRDKVFCHDCRFCCTLSVCTNQHGTYYKESSEKNMNGSTNKALGAIAGFSLDMELYKKPDFREI